MTMSVFSRLSCLALAALLLSLPQVAFAQAAPQPAGGTPPAGTAPAPKASNSTLTSPDQGAQKLIADAIMKMKKNDVDGSLRSLNQALVLNPSSTGAYVLRASIFCQRHQFDLAEADFNSALRIAPTNVVLKFNIAEVKFMQKQYDVARPGFAALTGDPDMGDFASYKVFLCDLFGGHEAVARKELDHFNDVMGNASYYFANAAWDLYHKDIEGARGWLLSATRIYPVPKFTTYGQSLRDLGYLPIPEPKDSNLSQ
jgi:Tfp pilus assembly protein PilF